MFKLQVVGYSIFQYESPQRKESNGMLSINQQGYHQGLYLQKVSSSIGPDRRIMLGLWSSISSVISSAPAVARRSVTMRFDASLAVLCNESVDCFKKNRAA